jgi:hypothetical protein
MINNAGRITFRADLVGSGVNNTNNTGIWSEGTGTLTLIAREGSQAPGTPNGVQFTFFFYAPVINAAGQTAFHAGLKGSGVDSTNNAGIWSEGSGILALLAREGSQAPGTASGVNFYSFGSPSSMPVINAAGQTAFQATLTGSGINSTNSVGIWATDSSGVLQLIIRASDLIEVAPSEFRTVSSLDFVSHSGNSDGRGSGFNDSGQLAFRANFTDGSSGIFVSDLVAISLPGDFNDDGVVDAADYAVWSKNFSHDQAKYNQWLANFGNTSSGSGAAANASDDRTSIPEPSSLLLLALAFVGVCIVRTRSGA